MGIEYKTTGWADKLASHSANSDFLCVKVLSHHNCMCYNYIYTLEQSTLRGL